MDMETPQDLSLSPEEGAEVIRIVTAYIRKETGNDDQETNRLLTNLSDLVQKPAAKLVHLGNTVFLCLVKEKGVVEFHTMTVEDKGKELIGNIDALVRYLKNIGTTRVYSYTDNPYFKRLARMSEFDWQQSQQKGVDNKDYTVYTLELV